MLISVEDYLKKFETKKEKVPRHEIAASVDEIKKVLNFDDKGKYGYKYWLRKVKRSGKGYTEILGILKEIEAMDKKYNKGGRLTNILSGK